jgi:hypothetical protein
MMSLAVLYQTKGLGRRFSVMPKVDRVGALVVTQLGVFERQSPMHPRVRYWPRQRHGVLRLQVLLALPR